MNYCDKIHYSLYVASAIDFSSMIDDLLLQLPEKESVLRLILFGTPALEEEYVAWRQIFKMKVRRFFGDCEPALSYVSQPVLDASLVLEVHSYRPDTDERISYRCYEDIPYVLVENESGRFLFAGRFQGDESCTDREQQSVAAFRQLKGVLDKESFPVNSIIRQWNYIEQITGYDGAGQHYQSFNNVRTAFYAESDWSKGYPAATGIGMDLGGILIDVDAAVFHTSDAFATPIDNKLQVAAHAYSGQVLEEARQKKTTPKFERAKSMTFHDRRLVYISGTAAIRGEESLKGVGLERQLQITMENIAQLIDDARLVMLRVYLKNKSDYEVARRELESYGLNIPVSYLQAGVCREELLIEIEGIAIE